MLICPVTKKCEFIVPVAKTPTLLTVILRPFGPGRQHFNTWDLTSAVGLHSVKFHPDPLKFAGVIRHIIPSRYTESVCAVMFHTQTKILNCCWFWANTYACKRRPTIRYFTPICKVTTSKFTAKPLLLSHSEKCIKLNFVVVSHKIFWSGCFAPPYLLRPGATAPLCPPLLRHWSFDTFCLVAPQP